MNEQRDMATTLSLAQEAEKRAQEREQWARVLGKDSLNLADPTSKVPYTHSSGTDVRKTWARFGFICKGK